MIIDKVAPFYTDEDKIRLREYRDKIYAILERSDNEDELEALAILMDEEKKLRSEIENRYIDSFKGNTAAILEDVFEIMNAIEKEDYISVQKLNTEKMKPILANKPDKNSPEGEKKRYKEAKRLSVQGYENCYNFLIWRIRVQLNAISFYDGEEGEAKILEIAEKRAESFYKKPKGLKREERKTLERTLPIIKGAEVRGDLINMPSSPLTQLLSEILGYSDSELGLYATRKDRTNRKQKIVIKGNKDTRRISYSKGNDKLTIEISDFRKILNRNPQVKKILARILIRANEQAIHKGELTKTTVTFPLRELVGKGQYKNPDTARQGYYNATDILTSFKISGTMKKGEKEQIQQGKHVVLFTSAEVDKATCTIDLNIRFNWALITPYYSVLPDFYFELPQKAADLLEYIFYRARQTNPENNMIRFNISYRAIQTILNLPEEVKNGKTINNPKRDIKDVIELAIEQIEEAYCKYAPPIPENATGEAAEPDFSLLPKADYDAPIKQYLDEGRLEVTLRRGYAQRLIDIDKKKTDKIERITRRKQRIEDKAKAINLAKKLKNEENDQNEED